MWSVDDVVKELNDAADLLHHKRATSPDCISNLETALMNGITAKLTSLPMCTKAALALYKAVDDNANFTKEFKNGIKEVVDQKLSAPVHADMPETTYKPQTINIAYYLTKPDWELLLGQASYHTKIQVLAKKFRILGLQSLAEQSVKHATVTMLTTYKSIPGPQEIYKLVQDIKLAFASAEPHTHLPFLLTYPQAPASLQKELYDHAYANGEAPLNHCPESFALLGKKVPLRKSSKLLQEPQSAPSQPQHQGHIGQQPMHLELGQGMPSMFNMTPQQLWAKAAAMQQMMEHGFMFNARQAKVEDEPTMPLRIPTPQQQLALPAPSQAPVVQVAPADAAKFRPKLRCDVALPLAPVENEEEEEKEENVKPSAKAIEEATFDALKAKRDNAKAKAKAAGKAKSKASAKPKSKPQAAPKKTISKQSKSGIPSKLAAFEYSTGLPDASWKGRTKDSWTSKHYHLARSLASKQGYDDQQCKEFARAAHKKAVEAWNKWKA